MNWRTGFFRAWIFVSLCWIVLFSAFAGRSVWDELQSAYSAQRIAARRVADPSKVGAMTYEEFYGVPATPTQAKPQPKAMSDEEFLSLGAPEPKKDADDPWAQFKEAPPEAGAPNPSEVISRFVGWLLGPPLGLFTLGASLGWVFGGFCSPRR